MKTQKWEDLATRRFGAEKLKKLRAQASAELALELNPPELGKTEHDVAGGWALSELLAGITDENCHGETPTGEAVGAEEA